MREEKLIQRLLPYTRIKASFASQLHSADRFLQIVAFSPLISKSHRAVVTATPWNMLQTRIAPLWSHAIMTYSS